MHESCLTVVSLMNLRQITEAQRYLQNCYGQHWKLPNKEKTKI